MSKKKVKTDDVKRDEEYSTCVSKCKCGHSMVMPVYQDKTICTWCGNTIRNSSRSYFKYKLKQAMK